MTTYPRALLTYDVTPSTVPYTTDPAKPSVVTLMLTATNATSRDVVCSQLSFTLHVGPGGGDLASSASGIVPSAGAGTEWSISGDGGGTFTATPEAGGGTFAPGDSLAFFLVGVKVDGVTGSGQIDVWEQSDQVRQAPPLGVAKTPPGLGITSFRASSVQVLPPAAVVLSWTTTHADDCELSWPGGGQPVDPAGRISVEPEETTTYTLTASGGGQSITEQLTVSVPQVRVASVGASPNRIVLGGRSTLSWRVVNASELWLEPGHVELKPQQRTYEVQPATNTTYRLYASGPGGTTSGQADVDVMPVAIDTLASSAAAPVPVGGVVTLSWSTRWASACTLEPGIGAVPPRGSIEVAPPQTTTYTLTAEGLGGPLTCTVTVTVVPVLAVSVPIQDAPGPLPVRGRFTARGGRALVFLSGSAYANEDGARFEFFLEIDDYGWYTASGCANTGYRHLSLGPAQFAVDLAPGPHTVTVRTADSHTLTDGNDSFNVWIIES